MSCFAQFEIGNSGVYLRYSKFSEEGAEDKWLIPVVVQDVVSHDVLMLAYMNREAFEETVRIQRSCFYSRSRQCLWRKGEKSGNVQLVRSTLIDCDNDTVLIKVEQIGGAACHTGYRSCFCRELVDGELKVIGERVFDPKDVYQQK